MFKNPLKYQEGGSVQDAMKQLVAWLVQNTGLDEGQVSQRLNQILSDNTAKQELVNNLQNMQKGDQNAAQNIIGMFVPQSAKFGGKIHDFICKHAHGGKTGCGCKQEGGSLEKSQKGITYNPYQIRLEQPENTWKKVNQMANISPNDINREKYWSLYRNFHGLPDPITVEEPLNNKVQGPKERLAGMENGGMVQKNALGSDGIGKYSASGRKLKISEVPNMPVDFNPVNVTTETLPTGARRMVFNAVDSNGQAVADTVININGVRYRSPHVLKTWNKNNNSSLTPSESAWYDANYYFDEAKDDNILNALEYDNGGKVAMSQGGGSDSNWFTRMYNRFIGRRVPDTVEATDRRLKTWTDANGVQHIVEDANVNGNSTVTTIDINGADTLGKEKITTGDGRYRILNLQPGTPEWRAAMSRDVQEQENGGLIEAGKKGISRLEALNKAKELYGYNDSQAKFAYANAKAALRNQGLRGKVEKAQKGEKTNDTPYNGTISQGKPRSKVSQAIDNNSKARNFVKGAKQFAKSPMVKWPLAGALAYGGYHLGLTPTVQSMGEELAPHMAPYLFPFLSQMRPKFILDTMNPMKEPPKVEKLSDVFWTVPSNEKGGKVEKAQSGTRSLYQQITADGPETYTDGYGTVRQMNESPVIAGLRKAYHWINMDRTLSDNAYSQKHGYSKPLTGMPPAVYISPVAQEINLAKYIGFRTPTQASLNQRGAATIKAEADRLKAIEAASKEGRYYVEPEPSDLDINKLPTFNNSIDVNEYLKNLGPITINWPKFIGRNVLLPASGVVGSAAAGSYVATKKDKNKKSENK